MHVLMVNVNLKNNSSTARKKFLCGHIYLRSIAIIFSFIKHKIGCQEVHKDSIINTICQPLRIFFFRFLNLIYKNGNALYNYNSKNLMRI